ncbi:MAG: hypothetical protein EBY47_09890, partial [Actinobacteria bacterium]|nr:hypothetical protein [Actinomycetota bacterium]
MTKVNPKRITAMTPMSIHADRGIDETRRALRTSIRCRADFSPLTDTKVLAGIVATEVAAGHVTGM